MQVARDMRKHKLRMGAKNWWRWVRTNHTPSPAHTPPERLADPPAASRQPVPAEAMADFLGVDPDTPWGRPPLSAALAKVQHKADPEQFQMFHLHVLRHWPACKVARKLGVSLSRVYLATYRIGRQIKAEAKQGSGNVGVAS